MLWSLNLSQPWYPIYQYMNVTSMNVSWPLQDDSGAIILKLGGHLEVRLVKIKEIGQINHTEAEWLV